MDKHQYVFLLFHSLNFVSNFKGNSSFQLHLTLTAGGIFLTSKRYSITLRRDENGTELLNKFYLSRFPFWKKQVIKHILVITEF